MENTLFSQENQHLSLLFTLDVDTELSKTLGKAIKLYEKCPEIEKMILHDLDVYAVKEKKRRLTDADWIRKQTLTLDLDAEESKKPVDVQLSVGRTRMIPAVVYLCTVLEGSFQSLTDKQAEERIKDSRTLQYFFKSHGFGKIPARSTRHENVRKISKETHDYILQQQLMMIKEQNLDDFKNLTIDSTAVKANTKWPTDSGLMDDIFTRSYHLSQQLYIRFGIPNFLPGFMPLWLSKISCLNFRINVTSGKGATEKRKVLYKELYAVIEKASSHMSREITKRRSQKEEVNLLPSSAEQLNRLWKKIEGYISDSHKVMAYSRERIIEGKQIENGIKIISLSDGAAAFITKGDRETVVGYRPQLGRSGEGFVTAIIVPEGNAPDAPQLGPVVKAAIRNTGVVPAVVSTDDGYASQKGRDGVLDIDGISVVSINGSKGRKLISEEDWESEMHKDARRMRSAVESLMFVLKYVLDFGRLRRRGIEAVGIELLQKVIVHNFRWMSVVEEKNKKKERQQKARLLQVS